MIDKLTYINSQDLFADASAIIETAKNIACRSINITLVQRNWLLGKRIAEEQLGDQTREELYGQKIVDEETIVVHDAYKDEVFFSQSHIKAFVFNEVYVTIGLTALKLNFDYEKDIYSYLCCPDFYGCVCAGCAAGRCRRCKGYGGCS